MAKSIFVYEYLVAGSTLLAAMAVGCSVGYPSVLLQQLNSEDSSIALDWDTASWIGSIHGITGVPSVMMAAFMQWKGRKLAFILACLIGIIGWILSYISTSVTYLLISESFHGFGSQSIMAVGLLSMSEMLSPQTRNMALGLYMVMQTLGMAMVQIAGSYLHWKTVSLVISAPLIITVGAACTWPESPAWLAYRGEFNKCAKAFTRLRGTGEDAQTELEELLLAQQENISRDKCKKLSLLIRLWQTLTSRDFYLPCIHMFILLQSPYWSGLMAHIIYASDIIQRATHSKHAAFIGSMILNSALFGSCIISIILIRYFQPKKVSLVSLGIAATSLLSASAVNYFHTSSLMTSESYTCLYLLVLFTLGMSMIIPIVFTVTAELMPVKHRGIGGPIYVISTCLMHTSSLKAAPYLIKYLNLWGTWLLFASNAIFCGFITWKYIPDTKGRTLQQLEDYYNYGNFETRRRSNTEKFLHELMPVND